MYTGQQNLKLIILVDQEGLIKHLDGDLELWIDLLSKISNRV